MFIKFTDFEYRLLNENKIGELKGLAVVKARHVSSLRNGVLRQRNLSDSRLLKAIELGLELSNQSTCDIEGKYHIKGTFNTKNVGIVVLVGSNIKVITIIIQSKPVFVNKQQCSVFNISLI